MSAAKQSERQRHLEKVFSPSAKHGDFLAYALRLYYTKYKSLSRPTLAERSAIIDLMAKHHTKTMQAEFADLLDSGSLAPKQTSRPFSAFIYKMQGIKISPRCGARCHIKREYFGVYDFATALSKKSGYCWLSERVTGEWTAGDRESARRAIRWLVEHGWLEELAPRHKRRGRRFYQPVEHDEWIAAHGDGYGDENEDPCRTAQEEKELF